MSKCKHLCHLCALALTLPMLTGSQGCSPSGLDPRAPRFVELRLADGETTGSLILRDRAPLWVETSLSASLTSSGATTETMTIHLGSHADRSSGLFTHMISAASGALGGWLGAR